MIYLLLYLAIALVLFLVARDPGDNITSAVLALCWPVVIAAAVLVDAFGEEE